MVKCGRCNVVHANAAEVRACYNSPLPERTAAPKIDGPRATEKQVSYIRSLLSDLGRDESSLPKEADAYEMREASTLISSLVEEAKSSPPKERSARIGNTTVQGTVPSDGTYTVFGEGDRVTIRFHTPRQGRYKGASTVEYLFGPDNNSDFRRFGVATETGIQIFHTHLGSSRLIEAVRFMLAASEEGRQEAGFTYAMESGNCYRCGRKLTVPASITRGLGPVCAEVA